MSAADTLKNLIAVQVPGFEQMPADKRGPMMLVAAASFASQVLKDSPPGTVQATARDFLITSLIEVGARKPEPRAADND
jgi:hypothetical protein